MSSFSSQRAPVLPILMSSRGDGIVISHGNTIPSGIPGWLAEDALVRSRLLSNTGRTGPDESPGSSGNGAPIFFGTSLLTGSSKPTRNFRPGGAAVRVQLKGAALAPLPIELQAKMYLWFTCALCKNRYRSPRFPFTFLQCRKPTWHVLHLGQACWRRLGGLVSLRLNVAQTWNSVSASTGAGGASFTGGCSTDASS